MPGERITPCASSNGCNQGSGRETGRKGGDLLHANSSEPSAQSTMPLQWALFEMHMLPPQENCPLLHLTSRDVDTSWARKGGDGERGSIIVWLQRIRTYSMIVRPKRQHSPCGRRRRLFCQYTGHYDRRFEPPGMRRLLPTTGAPPNSWGVQLQMSALGSVVVPAWNAVRMMQQ